MKKDYYEVLGISKTATDAEIKSAFRKMAKQYHPDINKAPDAAEKFKEAQEAYAVLSDPNKRKQYDQYGHAAFDNNGESGGYDFSGFDFSDIFSDLFGSSFGGFNFGGRSTTSRGSRKGDDSLVRVNLTFLEAINGCKKTIKVASSEACPDCNGKGGLGEKTCSACHGSGTVTSEQRSIFGSFMTRTTCDTCHGKGTTYEKTCTTCHGTGKINKTKEIEVKVPAGVDNGNQLRVAGKGEAGYNGGPNGDLYIEFKVEEHPIFEREEDDIYLFLPITIVDCVLGCKKDVPTIDGTIKLTIPENSKTGDKLRIKGKGVPNVNSGKKGDMYVVLNILPPTKLTREQKTLLEKLRDTDLEDNKEFKKIREYL